MALPGEPIEIAYRIPGKGWQRKKFKTQAEADKFVEKLIEKEGDDVEVQWAASINVASQFPLRADAMRRRGMSKADITCSLEEVAAYACAELSPDDQKKLDSYRSSLTDYFRQLTMISSGMSGIAAKSQQLDKAFSDKVSKIEDLIDEARRSLGPIRG